MNAVKASVIAAVVLGVWVFLLAAWFIPRGT